MARILIVEDEADIRANLARFLRLEGHSVIEAESGLRALEAAANEHPELILCDLMMPGPDGLQVLRAIRSAPAMRHIRFCFLTASAEKDCRESCLAEGADDYLVKPFQLADLRTVIARLLTA
jgi:CheY-like chemotaxis protein